MGTLIEFIALISIIAAIVRVLFSFIDWYSSNDGDKFIRGRLDELWENIHIKSVRTLTNQALLRLYSKISQLEGLRFYFYVYVLSVVVNVICRFLLELHYYVNSGFLYDFTESRIFFVREFNLDKSILILEAILLSSIFDLISLKATLFILYISTRLNYTIAFIAMLIFDMIIIVFMIGMVDLVHNVHVLPFGIIDQMKALHSWFSIAYLIENFISVTKSAQEALFGINKNRSNIYVFVLSLTAALPTMLYLLIITFTVIIRIIPRRIWKFFVMLIYRITTDENRVLIQLGNFCAGLVIIFGLLTKLVS